MTVSFSELKCREVIDIATGARIGYIDDVLINTQSCAAESFVIFGRPRLGGIMGKEEDVVIDSKSIVMIGDDTILVKDSDSDVHD